VERILIAMFATICLAVIFFSCIVGAVLLANTLDKHGYLTHLTVFAALSWLFLIFMGFYKSMER